MTRNLPVPDGPRAPLNLRWLWWIGPPALITWLYRTVFPPRVRSWWCLPGHSTSHVALSLILGGGGWGTFWRNARPSLESSWPPKYSLGWNPHSDMLQKPGKRGWYVNGRIAGPQLGWNELWRDETQMHGPQLGWKTDYGRGD